MSERFPLTSEQLELLLAFEGANGLSDLAARVRRDPSVVSRGLQRLAEDWSVIEKRSGRWQITPLGSRVNEMSRSYLAALAQMAASKDDGTMPYLSDNALLVIINAQRAMVAPQRGAFSHPDAIPNMQRLLAHWRQTHRPTVHIRHLFQDKALSAFLDPLEPRIGEWVLEKSAASAFIGTRFAAELESRGIDIVILVGFTANECVDATAKQAVDLGFKTYVVGDATAMFDVVGRDGTIYPAARTHEMLLASLHACRAQTLSTMQVMQP